VVGINATARCRQHCCQAQHHVFGNAFQLRAAVARGQGRHSEGRAHFHYHVRSAQALKLSKSRSGVQQRHGQHWHAGVHCQKGGAGQPG